LRFIHFVPPYNHRSAGIRAVHYFAYLMRKAGYNAYVNNIGNPWGVPIYEGFADESDIVIYPEYIGGVNLLRAKNIARWILFYPSQLFGDCIIPANEYVMPYAKWLYDETKSQYAGELTEDNILELPTIEEGLFKPAPKTIESAYWVYKGAHHYDPTLVPHNSVEITATFPSTRQALAKLLGATKTFYTFDHDTAMSFEAKLSGCKVILLEKGKEPKEDLRISSCMDEEEDVKLVVKQAERMMRFYDR